MSTFEPMSGYPNCTNVSMSIYSSKSAGFFDELFGLNLQMPFLQNLQFFFVHLLSTSSFFTIVAIFFSPIVAVAFSVFGAFDDLTDALSSTTGAAGVIINLLATDAASTIGSSRSTNSAVCVVTETASLYSRTYLLLPKTTCAC